MPDSLAPTRLELIALALRYVLRTRNCYHGPKGFNLKDSKPPSPNCARCLARFALGDLVVEDDAVREKMIETLTKQESGP